MPSPSNDLGQLFIYSNLEYVMPDIQLVVGLGYGDEGKGGSVDFLAKEVPNSLVIRFNGGGQAAHNVHHRTYGHHTFAQFGSGTFQGANTHLSRFMLVDPVSFMAEADALRPKVPDVLTRVTVEEDALVVTSYHVAANRLLETSKGHGSCGMGIGETVYYALHNPSRAIRVRDLKDRTSLLRKLRLLRDYYVMQHLFRHCPAGREEDFRLLYDTQPEELILPLQRFISHVRIVNSGWLKLVAPTYTRLIFEGAQGVLLDQTHGTHPHTTWSDTTFNNAYQLLDGVRGDIHRIGVTRCYMTRHGNGPFVTENHDFDSYSQYDDNIRPSRQGAFRSGALDLVALRYAVQVLGGIDALSITHLDRLLPGGNGLYPVCDRYSTMGSSLPILSNLQSQSLRTEALKKETPEWSYWDRSSLIAKLCQELGASEALASYGKSAHNRIRVRGL